MPVIKQITVVLENKPGELARLGEALAQEKINIDALSVSDTTDAGLVRLVTRQHDEALRALAKAGLPAFAVEVLQLELYNKPGALADISRKLAKGKINIQYLYTGPSGPQDRATVIIRVTNPLAAAKLLE